MGWGFQTSPTTAGGKGGGSREPLSRSKPPEAVAERPAFTGGSETRDNRPPEWSEGTCPPKPTRFQVVLESTCNVEEPVNEGAHGGAFCRISHCRRRADGRDQ